MINRRRKPVSFRVSAVLLAAVLCMSGCGAGAAPADGGANAPASESDTAAPDGGQDAQPDEASVEAPNETNEAAPGANAQDVNLGIFGGGNPFDNDGGGSSSAEPAAQSGTDSAPDADKQETGSEPAEADWRKAMIDFVKQAENDGYMNFSLLYIDDDEIPEIAAIGDYEAAGCRVAAFNGSFYDGIITSRLDFEYVERGNILDDDGGHMDYYHDTLYEISHGQFVQIAEGTYTYTEFPPATDKNGREIMEYQWEGKTVTEEEYFENLRERVPIRELRQGYDYEHTFSSKAVIDACESGFGFSNLVSRYPSRGEMYILPESATYKYTNEDLSTLSKDELRYARNEILARHGRKFKDKDLQAYFNAKSWYYGFYEPADFDGKMMTMLNDTELANIEAIKALEK